MFCSKCGKDLPDGTRFCPKCGTAVTGPAGELNPNGARGPKPSATEAVSATTVKETFSKEKTRKMLLIAAFAAVLAAAAIFVLFKVLHSPVDGGAASDDSAMMEDEIPSDDTAEQDPVAELLAVIDQVEAAQRKASDEYSALYERDDIEAVEKFRQMARVFERFVAELDELRVQADAVSGLDAKLKTARDEYFAMLHDARSSHMETIEVMANYLEFLRDCLNWRPLLVDYDSLSVYSAALSEWSQEAEDAYAAITYPSCVEDVWKQYGAVLEYNGNLAEKIALSLQYDDFLRLYSAMTMEDWYSKAEENQYKRLFDCFEGERNHANNQYVIASALAGEIRAYTEMVPEEKNAYEFTHIRTGAIIADYDVIGTIYPSLYNTYDAFVILKTGCISGKRTIIVEAEIEGFTQQYRESFTLDSSYKEIYIKPPALTGELDLTAAKPAQLKITISEQNGTTIDAKSFSVTLKSKYDFDWYSDEYGTATQYNILCYLTPESSAITQLKREAINELQAMAGIESFVGYQTLPSLNQFVGTYLQTAGLMHALSADLGVRYNMDPFSISGSSQHIQFPEDVIANRSGLCIETSLVIASALQSAGMHAFLLFPPGHAQVAVEVWNRGENAGKYFLIETTALSSADNTLEHFVKNAAGMLEDPESNPSTGIITYYNSDQWHDYLANDVEYVVDCNDSRLLGMTQFAN